MCASYERSPHGRSPHCPKFEPPGGMGETESSAIVPAVARAIFAVMPASARRRHSILRKLGLSSTAAMVRYAIRHNVIEA